MASLLVNPDDEVYRRLNPDTLDPATKSVRRNAFYTNGGPDPKASVHVKRIAGSPEEALANANRSGFGMGLLKVSEIRALGLDVEPMDTPDDPAHAIITGISSRAHCTELAKKTAIVKWPQHQRQENQF